MRLSNEQVKVLRQTVMKYGLSTRVCSRSLYYPHKMRDYRSSILAALEHTELSSSQLLCESKYSKICHKLFMVIPECGDRTEARLWPVSIHIALKMQLVLQKKKAQKSAEFFGIIFGPTSPPEISIMAGTMFESICHNIFSGQFDLEPGHKFELQSLHASNETFWLEHQYREECTLDLTLKRKKDGWKIDRNHYYKPGRKNQATFDAVILTASKLFLLQMTINCNHKANPKGFQELKRALHPQHHISKTLGWELVFVVPKNIDTSYVKPVCVNSEHLNDAEKMWISSISQSKLVIDPGEYMNRNPRENGTEEEKILRNLGLDCF